MNILITEPQNYAETAIDIYRKVGTVTLASDDLWLNDAKDMNALVVRLGYHLSASLLSKIPTLKYIITPTTGLDHIDQTYCSEHQIQIISLKGEQSFLNSIPATAEHTLALMLAILRKLPAAVKSVADGNWNRNLFVSEEAKGKTLGILGMGRVGTQMAGYGQALGMHILYYDTDNTKENNVAIRAETLETLLELSDVLSIHIPFNHETAELLSTEKIAMMKPTAFVINTSRGGIIDEGAIADAIEKKELAGYATDVLANEYDETKHLQSNRIIHLMQNGYPIIITPHIAGATYNSMRRTEIFIASKFQQVILT